jgi:pyruvate/2-oxoglutarate dehydrogenase complex dihydrolipoamide acyltransferase (E2) component
VIHEVIIPKTGIYNEDVTLLAWLVEEGAHVSAGDPLFEMETSKVEQEIEADHSGWVHQQVTPGAVLAIGTEIGAIATTEEDYRRLMEAGS